MHVFTDKQTATLLAALRLFQRNRKDGEAMPHFEDEEPLNDEEIDALSESINVEVHPVEVGQVKFGVSVLVETNDLDGAADRLENVLDYGTVQESLGYAGLKVVGIYVETVEEPEG